MKYQITYTAVYYVDADNEDNALDLAMEQHSELPDGSWEAVRDPYASPLEQLKDGTYRVTEAHSVPVLVTDVTDGYWVAFKAVESLDDARDYYLGVWTDPADGKRYYDATVWLEDLGTALISAKQWNQISIWDIANNEAIPVN